MERDKLEFTSSAPTFTAKARHTLSRLQCTRHSSRLICPGRRVLATAPIRRLDLG